MTEQEINAACKSLNSALPLIEHFNIDLYPPLGGVQQEAFVDRTQWTACCLVRHKMGSCWKSWAYAPTLLEVIRKAALLSLQESRD